MDYNLSSLNSPHSIYCLYFPKISLTFHSLFCIIEILKYCAGEECLRPRIRRVAKGLYVLYIDTFSKGAEMVLLRILGACMPLLFLINRANRIKAAGHIIKFLVVSCSFSSFHRHIVSAHQITGMCGYLYCSCLLRRFLTLGYCSIPMFRIGGELNDFNK